MSAQPKTIELRDRIVEFRRVNRGEILANSKNPRRHPDTQRAALRNMLATVGIAGAALAYRSARAGGALVFIDGHLRDEEIPTNLPVLITDLSDDEADTLLAGYDHLSAMAGQDDAALIGLLQSLSAESLPATGYDDAAIRALVESVAAMEPPSDSAWDAATGSLPTGERSPYQQMTFTLHDTQAEIVKDAIERAKAAGPFVETGNENSNGNALARICEAYDGRG